MQTHLPLWRTRQPGVLDGTPALGADKFKLWLCHLWAGWFSLCVNLRVLSTETESYVTSLLLFFPLVSRKLGVQASLCCTRFQTHFRELVESFPFVSQDDLYCVWLSVSHVIFLSVVSQIKSSRMNLKHFLRIDASIEVTNPGWPFSTRLLMPLYSPSDDLCRVSGVSGEWFILFAPFIERWVGTDSLKAWFLKL